MDLTNRRCLRQDAANSVSRATKMIRIDSVAAVSGDNEDEQDDTPTGKKPVHHQLATTTAADAAAAVSASPGKENHNDQQQQCHECNRSLAESKHLVSISGQTNQWHSECFRCNICQRPLDKEVSCHIYKNTILCRDDYLKLQRDLTTKCSRCHWPIGASDWVRRASQYVYHLACFSCDICQRQLSTGEQFTIRAQQKKNYTVRLLCRLHFAIEPGNKQQQQASQLMKVANTHGNTIGGGGGGIVDEVLFEATLELDSAEPTKVGQPVGNQRAFSEQPNKSSETTTTGRYLHLLAGSSSGQQQQPTTVGDGSGPFLLDHHHHHHSSVILGGDTSRLAQFQPNFTIDPSFNLNHHHQLHLQSIHQQQRANGNQEAPSITSSETSSSSSAILTTNGGNNNCHSSSLASSKSKRVRTTFTEDQLSILQNHFQIDSNPDGQDLERIAVITGLTKRVTQVWFQNSRARQKKYMTKRKPNSQSNLQQGTSSGNNNSSNAAAATAEMISQQFINNHQQQQQPQISGGCFAKMNSAVAAQKWTEMTSRQDMDDNSPMDETQSSTMDDDDDEEENGDDGRDDANQEDSQED